MTQPQPIPRSVLDDTATRADLLNRVNAYLDQDLSEEECWEWQGYQLEGGYGRIGVVVGGVRFNILAHRLTYAWEYGDPFPWVIDHLCANPPCVNPKHLEATTQQVNTLRGESPSAERARSHYCVNGHPLYGDNLRQTEDRRTCLACQKQRYEKWADGKVTFKRHGNNKTHCVHGHPWVDENIRVRKDGSRECRECLLEHKRDWSRRRRAKEREAKLSDPNREPTLAERIIEVLADGPLPILHLAERLPDVKKSAVSESVKRMMERGELAEGPKVEVDWGKGVRKVKSYAVAFSHG